MTTIDGDLPQSGPDVVWENTVDKGKYSARVSRIGMYKGVLTVTDEVKKEVLLTEEVGLSHDAIFGPDVDDVRQWMDRTLEILPPAEEN